MSKTKFWLIEKRINGDEFSEPLAGQDFQSAVLDAKYYIACLSPHDKANLQYAFIADSEDLNEAENIFELFEYRSGR